MMLLLACATSPELAPKPVAGPPPSSLVPLDAPRLLRRMSLDLTGRLPDAVTLDAVEAVPAALNAWRDAYFDDPRFEQRLVELLAERWWTRVDDFEVDAFDYRLAEALEYTYERAVGDEPLRLIAHVVATGAPWTEIVTANYTMGNALLASLWPLSCPNGDDWAPCTYTDGRPAAGVLATNGLWWRYTTTSANLNRGRMAAMTRLLVCEDVLNRPISIASLTALSDPEAAAEAIRELPECYGCHADVDPAAASLMGFYWTVMYSRVEHGTYHPDREYLWSSTLGIAPAWYGTPIAGLSELGPAVAADPRFEGCAAQSFAELYWRRPITESDADRLAWLVSEWDGTGKAMVRAVLDTPEYQAGTDPDATGERVVRLLSPGQLASVFEDLTGYRWLQAGFDQMDNDTYGYRMLAGGVDGEVVSAVQAEPGLTWSLVVKRLAEMAATNVVAVDLDNPQARLLAGVGVASRPGDPAFDAAISALAWRLYAERATDAEVGAWGALWQEMADVSDPGSAWTGLLTVMFRDLRLVTE